VTSVNRSGQPPSGGSSDWAERVRWVKGDALEPASWREELSGAAAVISCVGAFGSDSFMERVCGDATVGAAQEAAKAGVPRFVFISAHNYQLPFVLQGYYRGKFKAEEAVKKNFPDTGFSLRPAFIHGPREVAGITVPLHLVGGPLEAVLSTPQARLLAGSVPMVGALLASPLHVDTVARAAVRASLDPTVPAGVLDISSIRDVAAGFASLT